MSSFRLLHHFQALDHKTIAIASEFCLCFCLVPQTLLFFFCGPLLRLNGWRILLLFFRRSGSLAYIYESVCAPKVLLRTPAKKPNENGAPADDRELEFSVIFTFHSQKCRRREWLPRSRRLFLRFCRRLFRRHEKSPSIDPTRIDLQ